MLQVVRMTDGTRLTVPGIIPKLSLTPGAQWRNAPTLGQDTASVMREVGLTDAQIEALQLRGVIA
jgi:formyl-CoA transferase